MCLFSEANNAVCTLEFTFGNHGDFTNVNSLTTSYVTIVLCSNGIFIMVSNQKLWPFCSVKSVQFLDIRRYISDIELLYNVNNYMNCLDHLFEFNFSVYRITSRKFLLFDTSH